MQLFSYEYTRVGRDIIIPIYTSVPVCYKYWMSSKCIPYLSFNYSCQLVFPNKYVTYVYND